MKAAKTIIIVAILRYLFIALNKQIHITADYEGWVDYFYLPAGLNIIALLVCGYVGAIGVAIGSFAWNIIHKDTNIFASIGLSAMPFISCSLSYLTYNHFYAVAPVEQWRRPTLKDVIIFVSLYAVINSVLHHLAFPFLLKVESFSVFSLVKMCIGDLSGALFVFILFNVLTSLVIDLVKRLSTMGRNSQK